MSRTKRSRRFNLNYSFDAIVEKEVKDDYVRSIGKKYHKRSYKKNRSIYDADVKAAADRDTVRLKQWELDNESALILYRRLKGKIDPFLGEDGICRRVKDVYPDFELFKKEFVSRYMDDQGDVIDNISDWISIHTPYAIEYHSKETRDGRFNSGVCDRWSSPKSARLNSRNEIRKNILDEEYDPDFLRKIKCY